MTFCGKKFSLYKSCSRVSLPNNWLVHVKKKKKKEKKNYNYNKSQKILIKNLQVVT